jgi:ribosome-binding factor A
MRSRTERLKEVIREEAAEMITQELSDPRIGFCTVTRIELSNDLSFATIHVSVLGGDADKRTTIRGLQDARGLIQRRVASRLKTRTTPHIEIKLDETIEKTFHIMEKIKEARASDPDGGKSTQPTEPDPSTTNAVGDEEEEDEEEDEVDEDAEDEEVEDDDEDVDVDEEDDEEEEEEKEADDEEEEVKPKRRKKK